jgi:protein arginine N-methyltransferase 1
LAEPKAIKYLDMMTCTLEDSKGITSADEPMNTFDFTMNGAKVQGKVSGIAGWFTADFKSRTDEGGINAPKLSHPSFLSTGPENGYTHWGQQVFYFNAGIPLLQGETTKLAGGLEMVRTKENARLYNCKIKYSASRSKNDDPDGHVLMKSSVTEQVYLIP